MFQMKTAAILKTEVAVKSAKKKEGNFCDVAAIKDTDLGRTNENVIVSICFHLWAVILYEIINKIQSRLIRHNNSDVTNQYYPF